MITTLPNAALADALPLLLAHLPLELASSSSRQHLPIAARSLLPFVRGLFELRLDAEADQVDLHQLVTRPEEWRAFNHFIAHHAPAHPSWQQLDRFMRACLDQASPLHEQIRSIWLELDGDLMAQGVAAPSVFAGFKRNQHLHATQTETLRVLLPHLQPSTLTQIDAVKRAADAAGVWVSHYGAMLARPQAAVRVNIHSLAHAKMAGFARALGWSGDAAAFEALIGWTRELGDIHVLALDVGDQVQSQIGIEVFFRVADNTIPRWRALLAILVARGLCAPDKAAALLKWQKLITPTTIDTQWVDWLIVENLLTRPDAFSALHCSLHHAKLTLTPHGVKAKAYLWFESKWLA